MSYSELPRLLAIVLVVFDDTTGAKVGFQVPEGSVSSTPASNNAASIPALGSSLSPDSHASSLPPGSSLLSATANAHRSTLPLSLHSFASHNLRGSYFDISSVSQYLIPRKKVVKHLLTVCVENCKILGFPVAIEGEQYPRNAFMYNVCFVFERNADLMPYEPVVRKTGRILRHMEETTQLLSDSAHELRLHSILEQIYEDLGSYSETSIPLDDANSLDLRLFPINPNPLPVKDWDIPVAMISLEDLKDRSWDVTMYSLAQWIDGTRSVKRIANLADVDLPLAREAVQHLLFYGCVILHDLFQYSNSYALVGGANSLASMTCDGELSRNIQAECESYVCISLPVTPFATLFRYYGKIRPGNTIRDWIDRNNIDTRAIDVRRMISFGIIKGFLRRVHVYPVWLDHPSFSAEEKGRGEVIVRDTLLSTIAFGDERRGRKATPRALHGVAAPNVSPEDRYKSVATPKPTPEISPNSLNMSGTKVRDDTPKPASVLRTEKYNTLVEQLNKKGYPVTLPNMLDGEHSADELCIRYRTSYKQLHQYLAKIGGGTYSSGTQNTDDRAHGHHHHGETHSDLGRVKLIFV